MAKNFYSYEKRQQELKKQKKRQDKLKKKQEKKLAKENGEEYNPNPVDPDSEEGAESPTDNNNEEN